MPSGKKAALCKAAFCRGWFFYNKLFRRIAKMTIIAVFASEFAVMAEKN